MNKMTVVTNGNILLETFGYLPTAGHGKVVHSEWETVRLWAVEILDPTTEQTIFQYSFTSLHGWACIARDRKEELTLAAKPESQVEYYGHVVRHTYLGRVVIAFVHGGTPPVCNEDDPMIHCHKLFLEPAPISVLDWANCVDGEEMLDLATAAQLDQRLLLSAALDCAGLCRHLAGKTRSAPRAFKSVERFVAGKGTEQRMQTAIQTNDAFAERRLNSSAAQAQAVWAASCRPENVVSFVVRSLVYSRYDPQTHYLNMHMPHFYAKEVLANCAKMIRRHVKLAEHPQLQKLVAQRNADYSKQLVVGSPETLARNPSLAWCYPDLDLETVRTALQMNPQLGPFLSPRQAARLSSGHAELKELPEFATEHQIGMGL